MGEFHEIVDFQILVKTARFEDFLHRFESHFFRHFNYLAQALSLVGGILEGVADSETVLRHDNDLSNFLIDRFQLLPFLHHFVLYHHALHPI
jgi:hypothetical protein